MAAPNVSAAPPGPEPREILTSHLDLIHRIVRSVAHRHGLNATAADELESAVWVRLVEHDYRAIRQYEGRSSLATFLTVVVTRLALDVRSSEWGRWRPSSRARALGADAVLFETLIFRDGYSTDEAESRLEAAGLRRPSAAVRSLAGNARSMPRRYLPIEMVTARLTTDDDPSARLTSEERRRRAREVSTTLARALAKLAPRDRLLLRLRHAEGLKVSTIARVLNEDARALYRRLTGLHRRLRRAVERDGVSAQDVNQIVGFNDTAMSGIIHNAPAA
jgi:RNA polymerase sigma factor (sigma-70 family)